MKHEFRHELEQKEKAALKIEVEIIETKKLLHKLRLSVISNYYKSGSAELQQQVQKNIQGSSVVSSEVRELDQKPIHPSLKKLIGKKPVNYEEILHSTRTTRRAAQEAISTINEKFNKNKPKRLAALAKPASSSNKTSEIAQLTSSRGKNQLKHTIVVGNTSQYINEQPSSSDITHKWMCYVRVKSSVPIERLVKKVRFHLDSSYKPNDVIDVASPPFQLTRRGYGEFGLKLSIFFHDDVQMKPVQVFHQLSLDKKLTGHQTLGNETTTELWTKNFLNEEEERKISIQATNEENQRPSHHLMDHDYCKSEEEKAVALKVEADVDRASPHLPLSTLLSVEEWIKSHERHSDHKTSADAKFSIDINIEDEIEESEEAFSCSENLEQENNFVRESCRQIGIKLPSSLHTSNFVLITALKFFVKFLIQRSDHEKGVLTSSSIEKAIRSRSEFDFLTFGNKMKQ